jgi:hypothetical protein
MSDKQDKREGFEFEAIVILPKSASPALRKTCIDLFDAMVVFARNPSEFNFALLRDLEYAYRNGIDEAHKALFQDTAESMPDQNLRGPSDSDTPAWEKELSFPPNQAEFVGCCQAKGCISPPMSSDYCWCFRHLPTTPDTRK